MEDFPDSSTLTAEPPQAGAPTGVEFFAEKPSEKPEPLEGRALKKAHQQIVENGVLGESEQAFALGYWAWQKKEGLYHKAPKVRELYRALCAAANYTIKADTPATRGTTRTVRVLGSGGITVSRAHLAALGLRAKDDFEVDVDTNTGRITLIPSEETFAAIQAACSGDSTSAEGE